MTAHNDITKDKLITKPATDLFREGWDRIFGKHYYIHNQPDQVNVHILSATAKLEDIPEGYEIRFSETNPDDWSLIEKRVKPIKE